MKKALLKDIVIPAGTVFSDAPKKTQRSANCIDAIFGLTNDTFGTVEYNLDDGDAEITEWFADIVGAA